MVCSGLFDCAKRIINITSWPNLVLQFQLSRKYDGLLCRDFFFLGRPLRPKENDDLKMGLLTSQYLDLWTPSVYAWTNLDSLLRAVTAAENCDIGWSLFGMLLSMVTTCEGSSALHKKKPRNIRCKSYSILLRFELFVNKVFFVFQEFSDTFRLVISSKLGLNYTVTSNH